MADRVPLKGIFNGSGDPTGIAEFTTSDTLGFADGGTGLSALGTAGQVLKVNSGASAIEFGNVADVINLDGANDLTGVTLALTDIFLVSDNGTEGKATLGQLNTLIAGSTIALTNKTIDLADNTVTGSLSEFNTALQGDSFVSLTGTETLTNKTLTSPTIATPAITGDSTTTGNIIFEGATDDTNETTLTVTDPTADRTITLPNATGTVVLKDTTDVLTQKTILMANNTIAGSLASFNTALTDDDFVSLTGSETLTNKTLTTPVIEHIDGSLIALDSAGDINLDAGGGDILLSDDGTEFGRITNNSTDLEIKVSTQDKDIKFIGDDGGSAITALSLDMSDAGAATFNGAVTANAGVKVDNITIDGTEIDLSSGDLTLDVAGDIYLNADGGNVVIQDGSSSVADFQNSSNDLELRILNQDKDFKIIGDDGGSTITAFSLDMSDAGAATFNGAVAIGGNATITGNLTVNGSTTTLSTTNSTIEDRLIELGTGTTGTPGNDMGIVMERGDSDNAFMGFDESADKFIVGTGSFTGASTGNLTITTGTLVANIEGNITGDLTGNADTATALETARTIAGQSFDGTANITIASTDLSNTAAIALLTSTQTFTNKTIDLDSNTLTGTLSEFNSALQGDSFVSLTGTETLTNKTLTSPAINEIIFEGATADANETTLTVVDPTADRTISLPNATDTLVGKATTDTLTNKTINLANNTVTTTLAQLQTAVSDATLVDLDDTQTLENKTLSNVTLTGTIDFGNYITGNLGIGGFLLFEGATADAYETSLRVVDPTADRAITLPNATGTVSLLDNTETLTNKTLTSPVLNTGVSGSAILDEDDFASDSATQLATQQSIKAYVATQVTAQDLDFQGDSGGALSIDLDSETLTIAGGTGIDTSGSSNTLTVAIDSTVATLTGTQTLTNKTLTSPTINTGTISLGADLTMGANDIVFEGSTADANETTLTVTDPTADRTITLPNATGTVVLQDTVDNLTNKIITSPVITSPTINGTLIGTAVKDEDDMASDSATHVASQQSIKAYVDAQLTAQDMDITSDSGTIDVDLDSETLTIAGGTGIDSSATGTTVTLAIDSTVATLTGTQTLTNKTLTTPTIEEIDGSTITLDSAGDITLDADGADIILSDGGTEFGRFTNSGTHLEIKSATNDKDIRFKGVDSNSEITALTLDMSLAGKALFNAGVSATTAEFSGDVNVDTGTLYVDTSNNRVGIGTTSPGKTLHIVSTTTDDTVLITTDENSSTAAPVLGFKRNSASPADSDYLGQIKFKGENDNDQEITYSKITGKILDASDGTEDGIIEFANIKAGAQTVTARLRSNELQLLNSTGLSVAGDATITGNLTVNGTTTTLSSTNSVISDTLIELANGTSGTPANDAGLVIERGSSDNAFIGFDESEDKFTLGTGSFTGASTGNLTITTGTLVANIEATTISLGGSDVLSTDNTKTVTNKTLTLGNNTISGTLAQFQTAVTDATLVDLDDSQTLTNKTIALGSNTVSGTTAEFNSALTDDSFATLTNTVTLTNKTLTTPTIEEIDGSTITLDSAGDINLDADGADIILKDGGTEFGRFTNDSTDLVIKVATQDKDIKFIGDDGGSAVTALTLDMSDAGKATFNGNVTAASLSLASGATVTAILDEDAFGSDSNTALATQQSIKAYVDAQLTASDLDFQGDSGGALSIDLDSETLTIAGGTGIDTSGSSNTLTVAIDSTVATLTGTQTLTNKTLTSPAIDTITRTGDFTVDASGDIILDADGADIIFKDAGTEIGRVTSSSFGLKAPDEQNIVFKGNDGESDINALTIDFSSGSGDISFAEGLTLSANKSIKFGDSGEHIAGDGTNLTITSSGDTIIDSTGDINLDAGGADVVFKDDGTEIGRLSNSSSDFVIKSAVSDKDVKIQGNDGGSTITALTLDMSDAGKATFNNNVTAASFTGASGATLTGFADEDDMASDSATLGVTQQSVKAYVDSKVTAQDLDFRTGTAGAGSVDLDSQALTFTGGTGINTSHSGQTVTFAIDGTVATDNNSLTLANKTLTLPTIAEIDTPASSDFTIDSAQDIILDADGADIIFKDDTTEFGRITNDSTDLVMKSAVSDKDFKIKGNDGGSEITALTLDMSEAGAATFNSTVTANAGLKADNITIDGTEIDLSSGDLTIDSAGDITLDADGADVNVADGGTTFGQFTNSSSDFVINAPVQDKDIIFKGDDGGSAITALTLDMSEAGAATFNAGITATTGTFSGAISGTQLSINENIIFEGATANDFETTVTVTDPTADRTLTLPDETGTVATRGFAVAMAIAL